MAASPRFKVYTPGQWYGAVAGMDIYILEATERGAERIARVEGPNQEANARRIIMCVNACAGMSTETLELAATGAPDVKEWFQGWSDQHTLEVQRDELAAALRLLVEVAEKAVSFPSSKSNWLDVTTAADNARAALVKVQA